MQQCIAFLLFVLSKKTKSRRSCQFCHLLGMNPETNAWLLEHVEMISLFFNGWLFLQPCMFQIISTGTPALFSKRDVSVRKGHCLVSSLTYVPPWLFSVIVSLSLWWLVGHTVLSWLDRQSILICTGDTASFDISPKNWLHWWFCFSQRAFSLFCPVHCMEKTWQLVSHCLSNIFNPICSPPSHFNAQISVVRLTQTPTVRAHIQMLTFTQSRPHVRVYTQARTKSQK